jgi:hypothetical protein
MCINDIDIWERTTLLRSREHHRRQPRDKPSGNKRGYLEVALLHIPTEGERFKVCVGQLIES